MSTKNKGFTLVEAIVLLVILAILAALLIPALTGYVDKAKEKRLIAGCRSCVQAAQTLAIEDYGLHGIDAPPDEAAVKRLADVKGQARDISLEEGNAAIASLTYWEGEDYVTYISQPYPHYTFDPALSLLTDQAWQWAQANQDTYKVNMNPNNTHAHLTINYSGQDPQPLTQQQLTYIFGDTQLDRELQYIYPLAVYDSENVDTKQLLNIQYVTPQDPTKTSGQNRYQATAFLIDGKIYTSTKVKNGKLEGRINTTGENKKTLQDMMNKNTYASTAEFITEITQNEDYVLVN